MNARVCAHVHACACVKGMMDHECCVAVYVKGMMDNERKIFRSFENSRGRFYWASSFLRVPKIESKAVRRLPR